MSTPVLFAAVVGCLGILGNFAMNADSATCLPSFFPESASCRPDPVPSRVAYHHPLTEYEKQQAELAAEEANHAPKGRFALPPLPEIETGVDLSASAPSSHGFVTRAHPSDVIYWLACLGGACLLLLCATH